VGNKKRLTGVPCGAKKKQPIILFGGLDEGKTEIFWGGGGGGGGGWGPGAKRTGRASLLNQTCRTGSHVMPLQRVREWVKIADGGKKLLKKIGNGSSGSRKLEAASTFSSIVFL